MDHIQARRISDVLTGRLIYPDPQTVHVSKQATAREEGTLSKPFRTIAAALTYAATLSPSATKRIVVLIHPGDYTETGLTGVQYVDLRGVERDSCVLESADANDILTVNVSDVRLDSLTFRATSTGLPLDVQASGVVDVFGCRFDAADASSRVEVDGSITFTECDLDGSGTAILVGNAGTIEVTRCTTNGHIQTSSDFIGRWSNLTSISGLGTADLELSQCSVSAGMSYAASGTLRLDGNDIIYSIGAALWIQASCTASFTNNTFSAAAGFGDIYVTAGTTTVLAFSGNKMGSRGVYAPGSIFQLPSTIAQINVGGPDDSFYDFRHVLLSITGDCTIKLCKNMLYSSGTYITMDQSYNITVDVDKFVLSANPDFFTGLGGYNLSGGGSLAFKSNAVNGRSQGRMHFVGDKVVTFTHHMHAGKITFEAATTTDTLFEAFDSEIRSEGTTNQPVIVIQSATPRLRFYDTHIEPFYDTQVQYAFVWDGAQNDTLELYNCRVYNGLPANSPFDRTGAETPTYKATHTEFTSTPQTGGFWTNSIPDGINGDIYLDNLVPSGGGLPNYSQILWVAKADNATKDGGLGTPFDSVVAAVNAAAALVPSASNIILIYVLPGIYVETARIFLREWVHIVGHDRRSTIIENSTGSSIANTDYPNSSMRELTLRATGTSALIYIWDTTATAPEFRNMVFLGNNDDDTAIYVGGGGKPTFINCDFLDVYNRAVLGTDTNFLNVITLHNCRMTGVAEINGGDIIANGCEVKDGAFELWFNGHSRFIGCRIDNTSANYGILYARNDGYDFEVVGCSIRSNTNDGIRISDDTSDIYMVGNKLRADAGGIPMYVGPSSYTIEFKEFSGNSIYGGGMVIGGLSSTVKFPANQTRYLGGDRDSVFANSFGLISVVRGIAADDTKIMVLADIDMGDPWTTALTTGSYTGTVIEGTGRGVTLTGANTTYPISVSTDVSLELRNIRLVTTVSFFARISAAAGGKLILRNVEMIGSIYLPSGDGTTQVVIEDSDISEFGAATAINIADADPEIIIRNSRLVGTPAIYWNSVTNNNVKLAYCSVHHSGGGANNPFNRAGVVTPNYRSHHCAYNSDPEAGGIFTNLIAAAQRFDCVDVNSFY